MSLDMGSELDEITNGVDNVSNLRSIHPNSRYDPGNIRFDNEITNFFGMKTQKSFLRTFYRPVNGIVEFFETFIPLS